MRFIASAFHCQCVSLPVRLGLAVFSLMVALLLFSPAAFAQTHGTYTVGYSGGSVGATHGTINDFGAGGGQYGTSGSASASTDSYGNGQTCSVSIPNPALSSPPPLTATFTWHPDPSNPNEPPPAAAIVSQTCQASWRVDNSSSGATGSGDASNGLGTTAPASTLGGTAGGTKYMVRSAPDPSHPLMTFFVECSPTAHFSGASGSTAHALVSGSIEVTYFASATPVFIDLGGTTLVNGVQEALTGQQITATLNGIPTNCTVTSYTWTQPSATCFKTYNETAASNQLVALGSADLTGPASGSTGVAPLAFYDRAQENLTVTCTVAMTAPDGTSLTVTATSTQVSVLKPSVTRWDIIQGYVQYDPSYNSKEYGPIQTFGLYGDLNATGDSNAGMIWRNATVSVPAPFSGNGQCTFTQLVNPDRLGYVGNNSTPLASNNGILGLDGSFDYGSRWNVTAMGNDVDSPLVILGRAGVSQQNPQSYDQSSASDALTTYIMYRPSGGVWVPLQKFSWTWSMTIKWDGSQWNLMASYPKTVGSAPPYTPTATPDPPQWTVVHTGL